MKRNDPGTAAPPSNGGDSGETSRGITLSHAVTIRRPAAELYRFWRQLTNLPRIMAHVVSVEEITSSQSHWVVKGPQNTTLEYDAAIIHETPDELIAWKTTGDPRVSHAGTVRFEAAPGGRGTEVRVTLEYHPPGGKAGELGARLLGSKPHDLIAEDLYRFKALMETGEIPTGEPRASSVNTEVTR